MDELPSYSTEALNVLNEFFDRDLIIYVEGEDDVHFWQRMCKIAGINSVEISVAGGFSELKKRIDQIVDEYAEIIVACDSDYHVLLKNKPEHPLIVKTYGYSIENTMYCTESLNRFVQKHSRNFKDFSSEASEWIKNFCSSAYKLLFFDVANELYAKGVRVMGDSCNRFLQSNSSCEISSAKVEEYIKSILAKFDSEELERTNSIFKSSNYDLAFIIRGHFLKSGVRNWLLKTVSRKLKSISDDHLYGDLIESCILCNQQDTCVQIEHTKTSLKEAYRVIMKTNLV